MNNPGWRRRFGAVSSNATIAARNIQMDWLDRLQWPAMFVTLLSAWMVASQRTWKRNEGFWLFLLSNVLWSIWGLHDGAYALVALQLSLAVLNIRGIRKTRRPEHSAGAYERERTAA
jgi:hypothetical protein